MSNCALQSASAAASPQIHRHGLNAVIVEFGDQITDATNARAQAFYAALEARGDPRVLEVAPTLTSVFVAFAPDIEFKPFLAFLGQIAHSIEVADIAARRLWQIPVCFAADHAPQLAEIAATTEQSVETLIGEIVATRLRVLAIGFAPGQPYLGMLPARWDWPRLTALNPQVPRGAIAVALRQIVLFQNPSPTGWRHIGQTQFLCFEPTRIQPFALEVGDAIEFGVVSALEFSAITANNQDGLGGAKLQVIS